MREWQGFKAGKWQEEINVKDFIMENYSEYRGSEKFLSVVTQKTRALNEKYLSLCEEERKHNGVLDIDVSTVSSPLTYAAGYLDKENELIVGLQTAKPLTRGVNPFGGMRMCESACTRICSQERWACLKTFIQNVERHALVLLCTLSVDRK